ncbi:hypothetical protein ABT301_22440 [Streptomyces sp. NPDC000987]|uniref:hypothetical protein n=1 Tax=unclassified Streptomyces TaxID=2593676 RepID=UPI002D771EC3|nr:hypothetical protein [Streptomyces sp. H51]
MGMYPMRTPDHCPRCGRRLAGPPAERVKADFIDPIKVTRSVLDTRASEHDAAQSGAQLRIPVTRTTV